MMTVFATSPDSTLKGLCCDLENLTGHRKIDGIIHNANIANNMLLAYPNPGPVMHSAN